MGSVSPGFAAARSRAKSPILVHSAPVFVHYVAHALADVWLAGAWSLPGLRQRSRELTQRRRLSKSLESMILGFWLELRDRPHQRRHEPLAAAIEVHPAFRYVTQIATEGAVSTPPEMAPPPRGWDLLDLPTLDSLGRWLEADPSELTWLADPRSIANHYIRYWRGTRLVEAPRRRLKSAQRRIAAGLLGRIPPHEAAHGFRSGRSVLTAVQPHAGQEVLLVADLRCFFPSIRTSRVHAMLQRAGYPEEVARHLTQLCTTSCQSLPRSEDAASPTAASRYRSRHLPQGAPTSPAIANLCAFRLDARLAGLARSFGGNYTRYADDMIFSGSTALGGESFLEIVGRIVSEEGFTLNAAKSRVMRRSQRQQVLGIVLNEEPTLSRRDLESLEAELFNCVRRGPPAPHQHSIEWLRDHLTGRVAWAKHVNSRRARRLVELLAAIDWTKPRTRA